MPRLIWLALFCLAGIGGLFAVRSVVAVSTINLVSPKAIAADVTDVATPPLAKGDRLPSQFFDGASPKTAVETVKIVPTEPPKQARGFVIRVPVPVAAIVGAKEPAPAPLVA